METLGAALQDLSSPEPARRLAASRALERAARRVSIAARKEALGTPAATAALATALGDEDPKVVQNAVIALAEISRRYFKDDRAYPALVRQLGSPDPLTRAWAATATVTLRGAVALPDVLPLARDRSARVRAEVVRLGVTLAIHPELPDPVRSELRALAETAANDPDCQVREFAANLARAAQPTAPMTP